MEEYVGGRDGRHGFDADVASQVVQAYLSRQHFEDVENSCPMVALPTDVTRSGDDAKRAFENAFAAMVGFAGAQCYG